MDIKLWIYAVMLIVLLLKVIKHRRLLYIVLVTLPRDIYTMAIFVQVTMFSIYCKVTNQTTAYYFDCQVKKRKGKTCFYYEDEVWTYEKVQEETYKVANYFQALGYKKGDTVALMMENRPEYIIIWVGLSRIGVITSLVNYNIRLKGLEHCISIVNCKAIIYGTELTNAIQEVKDAGGFNNLELFSVKDRKDVEKRLTMKHVDLSEELKSVDKTPTIFKQPINSDDIVLYVYTSGTTGLPKASIMKHSRVFGYSITSIAAGLKSGRDVLITPVPLYHVQGGVLGVTAAIFHGIPQVLVRKFSASRYWDQCVKYKVTASQYLGEIIRYLYNQPEKPVDRLHTVKTFFGNGVNPSIWSKFVQRFPNIKIKEIYGATEGNCNTMNLVGKIGACGHIPIWANFILPFFLAKVEDTTGDIIRDTKTGLAIQAETGQPGELLARISDTNCMRMFDGYTDKDATKKKIATDIKKKGDKWFRSGDLLVFDDYGYWYFKDRSGDTFRFKGENVSTAEVEEVITRAAEMKASVAYGVKLPFVEGKCGMTSIADPEGNLNLKILASEISRSLPTYARPLFIRVINQEMNMTGTFKLQKVELQKEGFDIERIKDSIYFYKEGNYVPLDKVLYEDVISGKMRF